MSTKTVDNTADHHWMQHTLNLAQHAAKQNEVPVGAVVVLDNQIIGEGWNQPISSCDPTAHAEIIALRNAAKKIGNYRLLNTTLYVTIEPCPMCCGAFIHARIKRLVYGAQDPKTGAVSSIFNLLDNPRLNHRVQVTHGLLAEESAALLQQFFSARRK